MGDVLVAQGKIRQANRQFDNSIKLAQQENPVRSLEEKNKVADYFNQTRQFDKEINLRKRAILETKQLNDSVLLITDNLDVGKKKEFNSGVFNDGIGNTLPEEKALSLANTLSENNYKIGRALVQKEDYKEAIPFLEKSIKDANLESDLVVKKDATRKLSEVYSNVGEYDLSLIHI